MLGHPSPKVACPKCKRPLAPAGEITIGDDTLLSYQCDTCTRVVDFLGEPAEVALTFCVDETGRPFDPASPEDDLSR